MELKPEQLFKFLEVAYRHGVLDELMPLVGESLDRVQSAAGQNMDDLLNKLDGAGSESIVRVDRLLALSPPLLLLASNDLVMSLLSRMLSLAPVRRMVVWGVANFLAWAVARADGSKLAFSWKSNGGRAKLELDYPCKRPAGLLPRVPGSGAEEGCVMAKSATDIKTELKTKLAEIVGSDRLTDGSSLEEFTGVPGALPSGKPLFRVLPRDVSEVRALVKLAIELGINLVPVSSNGPHFRGDTVPAGAGVIMDFRAMDRIVRVDRLTRWQSSSQA